MKKIYSHFKNYFFKGLLALIPLALTVFVIRLLYITVDKRVVAILDKVIGYSIPGLGIILILLFLYLIGLIVSNVIGSKLFSFIEKLFSKVPFVKMTYQIGKQVSTSFSIPEKQVFKRAVMVEFLKPGMWVIGFVTGTVIDKANKDEKLLKVFVPTPPLPTSGTMILVREEQIREPGWSIEEAMKVVISGGIIGPEKIG